MPSPTSITERLPAFMRQRLPLLLIALVVMGGTGVLIRSYLADRERQIEQRYRQKFKEFMTEKTPVVMATQDIPPDTVLKPSMFHEEEIPVSYVQPYSAGTINEVVGKRNVVPIAKGEQVTQTKLETLSGGGTLASKTPPGHRAITLAQEDALAGFIKPGDHVDLMWTLSLPQQAGGSQPVTMTLFQHVLVLAVGGEIVGGGAAVEGGRSSNAVTVALSPQESEFLFFAQGLGGKIHLALRPHTDKERVELPPTSTDSLLRLLLPHGPQVSQQPKGPLPPRQVEVFRGLQKEVVSIAQADAKVEQPIPPPGVASPPDEQSSNQQ